MKVSTYLNNFILKCILYHFNFYKCALRNYYLHKYMYKLQVFKNQFLNIRKKKLGN